MARGAAASLALAAGWDTETHMLWLSHSLNQENMLLIQEVNSRLITHRALTPRTEQWEGRAFCVWGKDMHNLDSEEFEFQNTKVLVFFFKGKTKLLHFKYGYTCLCVWECAHEPRVPVEPTCCLWSWSYTDCFKFLDTGAGNWTWTLCKNDTFSWEPRHLSSSRILVFNRWMAHKILIQ